MLTAAVVACVFASWGSRPALAEHHRMAVTAVGCLQGEREYRRDHESTKFAGTGVGLTDEYVLIDAMIGGPSMNVAPISEQESTNCTAARAGGQAFELKGKAESGLASYLGRRVVIHGLLLHAKHDAVGTNGTFTPAPTNGGVDPLNHDLELREINVENVSLVPVRAAAKNEPTIIGAPEPQPEAAPAAEPAPAAAAEPAPQAPAPAAPTLPKTASPLPAIGLLGLLSMMGAFGLRLLDRRWL
jgi:hypothetical protein